MYFIAWKLIRITWENLPPQINSTNNKKILKKLFIVISTAKLTVGRKPSPTPLMCRSPPQRKHFDFPDGTPLRMPTVAREEKHLKVQCLHIFIIVKVCCCEILFSCYWWFIYMALWSQWVFHQSNHKNQSWPVTYMEVSFLRWYSFSIFPNLYEDQLVLKKLSWTWSDLISYLATTFSLCMICYLPTNSYPILTKSYPNHNTYHLLSTNSTN